MHSSEHSCFSVFFLSLAGGDNLSLGSAMSVPDLNDGEIFIPPHPSVAPPPPPFIPPPPEFMGDLNSLDVQNVQPPPMPTSKHTSLAQSTGENGLIALKSPPMAPPKPPPNVSSVKVPHHPNFAPPLPPSEMHFQANKTPPPKPTRQSSISILDSPPQSPVPAPVQTPTLSTFNPQNTAKVYSVPQISLLHAYEEPKARPKQILVLDDSGSGKSTPVFDQLDGRAPKVAPQSITVSKDIQEQKENLQITKTPPSPMPEPSKKAKAGPVSAPVEKGNPLKLLRRMSPQSQTVTSPKLNQESSKYRPEGTPNQNSNFSPLLDNKLRNLKSSETSGARDEHVASPLALLMAAKERDKHRSTQTWLQENTAKKNETSTSIQPSETSPNSFIFTSRSRSSSSLTSQDIAMESPKSVVQKLQSPQRPSSPALVKDQIPFTSQAPNTMAASQNVASLVMQKQNEKQPPQESQSTQYEDDEDAFTMPLLPPPPEFDDFDELMEPPPSITPPDPPMTWAPSQTESIRPPSPVPPPPLPKFKPPPLPQPPPLGSITKPKLQLQTKPKVNAPQLPSPLSPNQVTLLSILQKKMLEMDQKMVPATGTESSSDDWGTPMSDEDSKVHTVPWATPQSNNHPVVKKAETLKMAELEAKMAKKHQQTSSVTIPTR